MNSALRNPGTADAALDARIQATRDGLAQLPPYEGTTYRGTNLPDSAVRDVIDRGVLRDPAFVSSSRDPGVAEGFINAFRDNPTRITIEGHSGVNVGPFSAAKGEAEILFRDGIPFEVLDYRYRPDGVLDIIVREP